ncbi:hypothetical protein EDD18DRAFT_1331894 [Armillaria luteobubalina]|uniref:Extracellular membrane protein CFEM domain-containing protein n=1 Tax=Armillaria luteobubalina TaxID=153913 RepID=A0AA39UT91_9AGAR|nr:hypothetical protein EDD18DRAFT_1331894 [Armillaria luteobubalina]
MMLSSILFISALFFSSARGAPTASLDASALLANGQAAQSQNVAFQSLSVNDTCSTGEVACISNEVAQCADNQWATSPCSGSAQCFALPSVRGNGTFLQCTSEKDAVSVIDASGATGGIFGNGTDTSASASTSTSNSTSASNSTATSAANSTDTASGTSAVDDSGVVTVTVTLTPTATVFVSTEVPVMTTLSPDEASSLLASLTGVAGGSVVTASPAVAASATATDADVAASASASTIMTLVPAAAATSAS